MPKQTDTNPHENWRFLPNLLSLARGVLAIPVYVMAIDGKWILGFWFMVVALLTDFFDGMAANKLHTESVIGGHIDRVSDFLLAAAGVLGLIIGAGTLPIWIVYIAVPITLFIGYVKFFLPEERKVRRITAIFSLILLFIAWIYVAWGYLMQAYGWSWWYPPITIVCLVLGAFKKKHRLKAWFGWVMPSFYKKTRFLFWKFVNK